MNKSGVELHTRDPKPVVAEPNAARYYLLFAGPGAQGSSDLAATFTDEREARRAFVDQRLLSATPGTWAQLAVVDPSGRTHVLAWFGWPAGHPAELGLQPNGTGDTSARPKRKEPDMRKTTPTSPARGGTAVRRTTEPCEGKDLLGPPETDDVTARSVQRARRRRRLAIAIALAAVAALWCGWAAAGREPPRGAPAVQSLHFSASTGIAVGLEVLSEQPMRFSPGASRAWKTDEGWHQVTVVAGTLSVEDGQGHRRDYGAGDGYLAGWSPYTALNRTGEAVHVTVRHLRPSTDAGSAPAPNK